MPPKENWKLKGRFFECCIQSGHCALWFGRDLTGEACKNFATFQIEEGHIDNVDMKGIIIIHRADGIGPKCEDLDPSKGGGMEEGAAYVSDNATKEQRKVLEPFVRNHLGAELWKTCLGVKFVKIEITEEKGIYHITYPFGEGKQTPAIGGDGKNYMRLENPTRYNLVVLPINCIFCNTLFWKYDDYGKHLEYHNTSGCMANFDCKGN